MDIVLAFVSGNARPEWDQANHRMFSRLFARILAVFVLWDVVLLWGNFANKWKIYHGW